jgi:succinyl-diaminopimelate desuccinylase
MSTRHLAEALIARASVTPSDAGCINLIAARLTPLSAHA